MWGIVPDVNCEGQLRIVLRLLHNESRRELWHFLNLAVLTFEELGLSIDATDREIWQACQRQEVLLITGNRNAEGPDSLEVVIRSANAPRSLPVITLADPQRVQRDSTYANQAADRLLDYLFDIELFRGVGRIFIP